MSALAGSVTVRVDRPTAMVAALDAAGWRTSSALDGTISVQDATPPKWEGSLPAPWWR